MNVIWADTAKLSDLLQHRDSVGLPRHPNLCLGNYKLFGLLGDLLVDEWRAHEVRANDIGAHARCAPSLATTMRPCLAVTLGALSLDASLECTDPI